MLTTKYTHYLSSLLLVFVAVLTFSCNEDDVAPDAPEDDSTAAKGIETFYIKNLVADTLANSGGFAKPLYFSLENNKVVSEDYALSNEWDICFSGTYNSSIYANNGSNPNSPGYGGPGQGLLYLNMVDEVEAKYYPGPGKPLTILPEKELFDEAFNATPEVPVADTEFSSSDIYLDFFMGSSYGWAYYDFYGKMFPDGDPALKSHVCYALPRVIIVKTAKGNYAKLVIYSMYENAPTVPDRAYTPGYITMTYAIQRDGSTDLNHNKE